MSCRKNENNDAYIYRTKKSSTPIYYHFIYTLILTDKFMFVRLSRIYQLNYK